LMDNIDTGTATGKMVVGVLAVLAEFERNLLMERCAWGEDRASANPCEPGVIASDVVPPHCTKWRAPLQWREIIKTASSQITTPCVPENSLSL